MVTPPRVPGPADITVTTPGGSVTVPDAFGYKAPPATSVTSTPDPALVGQPVTFTAVVTGVPPTTGTPTGTVTFDFGDGTSSVTAPVTDGTATVSHVYTAPSDTPCAVTTGYNGDVNSRPPRGPPRRWRTEGRRDHPALRLVRGFGGRVRLRPPVHPRRHDLTVHLLPLRVPGR